MNISKESPEEFQRIYLDEFGEEIPYDKASEMASQFLALYEAMYYRPPAWRCFRKFILKEFNSEDVEVIPFNLVACFWIIWYNHSQTTSSIGHPEIPSFLMVWGGQWRTP